MMESEFLSRLAALRYVVSVHDEERILFHLIIQAIESLAMVTPCDDLVDEEKPTALLHSMRPTLRGDVDQGLPCVPLGKWSLKTLEWWLHSLERSAKPSCPKTAGRRLGTGSAVVPPITAPTQARGPPEGQNQKGRPM